MEQELVSKVAATPSNLSSEDNKCDDNYCDVTCFALLRVVSGA
jgi:hypothetical protein